MVNIWAKLKSAILPALKFHRSKLWLVFVAGVSLFALLMLINHRAIGSDDTIFQTQIIPYDTVFEWITYRYQSWSGRIVSEGIIYFFATANFVVWQFINTLMYGLFCGILFLYYRLMLEKSDKNTSLRYIVLACILSLPFLMHPEVANGGMIWMTGSMVYFWACTFGLVALYPVLVYVKKRRTSPFLVAISFIATILATLSQEQVGLVLAGLLATSTYISLWDQTKQKRNFPYYPVVLTVTSIVSFFISYSAAGNVARSQLEAARWIPDFYTAPMAERVVTSARWVADAIINHSGILLPITWLCLGALFLLYGKKKLQSKALGVLFLSVGTLALVSTSAGVRFLFQFYPGWHQEPESMFGSLIFIPWLAIVCITILAPILLFRNRKGVVIGVLILAAVLSASVMTLSPTLYASAWRSMYTSSVILGVVAITLLHELLCRSKLTTVGAISIFTVLLALFLSGYLYQVGHLTQ